MAQVRSAYRRRGWGFTDPQQIAQCAKEGFVEKLREQAGEGCHLWGVLNVNKARSHMLELIHVTPKKLDRIGVLNVNQACSAC